jgi:hypothetical protein
MLPRLTHTISPCFTTLQAVAALRHDMASLEAEKAANARRYSFAHKKDFS